MAQHNRVGLPGKARPCCQPPPVLQSPAPSRASQQPTRTASTTSPPNVPLRAKFPTTSPTTSDSRSGSAPVATAAATFRPDRSRATADPLPPFGSKITCLRALGDGIWCLQQSFAWTEPALNCFVIRLRSGGLMVINPVAFTEEASALFDSIPGSDRVEHVVLTSVSPEHWYYAPDWVDRFAGAIVWTVPGLLVGRGPAALYGGPRRLQEGLPRGAARQVPGEGPLPGLEGQVQVAVYQDPSGAVCEAAVLLEAYGAVVVADFAWGVFQNPMPEWAVPAAKVARFYKRLGCPVPYLSLRFGGERAKRWASLVLGWGAARVLCCHFDPEVPQGPEELRRCLSFLV